MSNKNKHEDIFIFLIRLTSVLYLNKEFLKKKTSLWIDIQTASNRINLETIQNVLMKGPLRGLS